MKIFLINPTGGYQHEYPPLGLLYIASSIRNAGYEVDFYDEGAMTSLPPLIDYLVDVRPYICAFSLYTTNVIHSFKLIEQIKKKIPTCRIIVGGPHATAVPELTLQECLLIDYLVSGEGEITIIELLRALEGKVPIEDVRGIYFRKGESIIHANSRGLIEHLDKVAFPAYDLIQQFKYVYDPIKIGNKLATIVSSRGCPYNCDFCSKAVFGFTYRRRSPKNVVEEIRLQMEYYEIDEVYFMDDLFAKDSNWLNEFFIELEHHNIRLPWKCLCRPGMLGIDDYKKMKAHGCYLIQFGVESGSQEVLDDIGKKLKLEKIKKSFNEAKRAGLLTYGFFIFGHRKDNPETVRETLEFAMNLKCDFVSFFCLVPFPGTKVSAYVSKEERYCWQRIQYLNWNENILPISICSVSPSDLAKYEKQAFVEYFGRFSYLWHNILLSKDVKNLKRRKIMLWCENFNQLFKLQKNKERIFYPEKRVLDFLTFQLRKVIVCTWRLIRYTYKPVRQALYLLHLWMISIGILFKVLKYFLSSTRLPTKIELDRGLHNNQAFINIWKDYLSNNDRLKMAVDLHIKERAPFIDLLIRYISQFNNKAKVLEVGCGTAIDSYCAAKRVKAEYFATDISIEAIETAQRIGEILGCKIKLLLGDATKMQFPDKSFDIVFSQGLVEHFHDPLVVMREKVRVLKDEGYLLIDVPQKYNPYTAYKHKMLEKGRWHYGWETEYSYAELKKLGLRLNLQIVEVVGRGYALNEDFGFSEIRFLGDRIKKGGSVRRSIGQLYEKFWQFLEKYWGHYFMQCITVVYKKHKSVDEK